MSYDKTKYVLGKISDTILGKTWVERSANIINFSLMAVPFLGEFQMVSMALDMADIYGYGKVMTQDGFKSQIDLVNDAMATKFNSAELENELRTTIFSSPDLAGLDDSIKEQVLQSVLVEFRQRFTLATPSEAAMGNLSGCYTNKLNFSGTPTSTCPSTYVSDYDKYVRDNTPRFSAMTYDDLKKAALDSHPQIAKKVEEAGKKVDAGHNIVLIYSVVAISCLALAIILFFWWLFY